LIIFETAKNRIFLVTEIYIIFMRWTPTIKYPTKKKKKKKKRYFISLPLVKYVALSSASSSAKVTDADAVLRVFPYREMKKD
jgi:hypothetical protein